MTRIWRIDNRLPVGMRADWLIGAGATRAERTLMYGAASAGAALVWLLSQRPALTGWDAWQSVLGLVIAADLFGGAMANMASSTKRQYQAPLSEGASALARLVHSPVSFAALHVYPFIVVALYPGGTWRWAIGWYAGMLVSVIVVTRVVPTYLERPAAMTVFVLAVPVAIAFPGPPGWQWLPYVFLAKLLVGHAVHEEAYRPTSHDSSAGRD
jgi:hypothetical protein